jgi:aldehyde dehydrogenase (NAD+)
MPLVGAIAAGNCVVMKPSEVSSHVAAVIGDILPRYLNNECFKVIQGGIPETTELLKQRFDKIMYTGNGFVGRIVMRAAAEHLTPVDLELGGKSPCFVSADANIAVAARRIAQGRFSNMGQTCVAPDYVLVDKSIEQQFLEALKDTLIQFFGDSSTSSNSINADCPDLGRLVNERHFDRVLSMLDGADVYTGGGSDRSCCFIEPTIVQNVGYDSPLMQSEIFGPVLPVIAVETMDEAIAYVNAHDKPLALYIFSESSTMSDHILSHTCSGTAAVNETINQIINPEMPFGGIGPSGMGAYNGKHTFHAFSHRRSVLKNSTWLDPDFRYPPFTQSKQDLVLRIAPMRLPSCSLSSGAHTLLTLVSLGIAIFSSYMWYECSK